MTRFQLFAVSAVQSGAYGKQPTHRENYRPISITPILSKVYEKLVFHKQSSFCDKYGLLPAAQFAYRKFLSCTDALLTIFHHLQKSLDAVMESYIVQLYFSAAFDIVSHSGLLLKLKSIDVGGSVVFSCTEFLSDRMQRVMVDGAANEWIKIISGVPPGSVLGPLLFILYTSEMFELVENRLFSYAYDCTLLAVVRKPADRSAVAASLNRDLVRIEQWCNHWCMILNPNKTKALAVSGSGTVNPPHGDLVLSGVSIRAIVPTSTSLEWSVTASPPSKTMCVVLFHVSLNELVFWRWWNVYLWTPQCYFVAILHLFS